MLEYVLHSMCLSLQTKNKILSKNRTPKKISEDEDKIEKQLGNLHNLSYVYILKINVNILWCLYLVTYSNMEYHVRYE